MDSYKLYSSLPFCGADKNLAVIDADALVRNRELLMNEIHKSSPHTRDICVVKADAYGHGIAHCVPALVRSGCGFFAVSCIEEAMALRSLLNSLKSNAEILILGYTAPESAGLLIENNIIQCVFSMEYAEKLNENSKEKLKVHIKLDTGMSRIGFFVPSVVGAELVARELEGIFKLSGLSVCGTFTHFSRADEMTAEGDSFTVGQYEKFIAVAEGLRRLGLDPGMLHACNSAGAIRFPDFALDGVRIGIVLYGGGVKLEGLDLKPVMSLYTRISHIHTLYKGEPLGYGGTYVAESDRVIATLPIGYADGFLRAYGGASVVILTSNGEREARLVGRICMDQCMVDVTGLDVQVGDTVRLFGGDRSMLDGLAARAETIDYECLCLISARVPRKRFNAKRR